MLALAELKQDLQFNRNLGELIEVMKLVSVLQFNHFRSHLQLGGVFIEELERCLDLFFSCYPENFLFKDKEEAPSGILVVSSDEGFLGELIPQLISQALQEADRKEDKLIVIGQQGAGFLEELGRDCITFRAMPEKVRYEEVLEIRDYVFGLFLKGEIGRLKVVYPRFVSLTFQEIETQVLLPVIRQPQAKIFKFLGVGEILFEPEEGYSLMKAVKFWLGYRLFEISSWAKLSELAARIMHLEGSIQEIQNIQKKLHLEYLKHLHALSDKTIREVSASRLLWR